MQEPHGATSFIFESFNDAMCIADYLRTHGASPEGVAVTGRVLSVCPRCCGAVGETHLIRLMDCQRIVGRAVIAVNIINERDDAHRITL